MRTLLMAVMATLIVGTSAGASLGLNGGPAEDLLKGILQDVGAILNSFVGGPDDPSNPVVNSATLQQDAQRLDAATRKANALANELQKMQPTPSARDR